MGESNESAADVVLPANQLLLALMGGYRLDASGVLDASCESFVPIEVAIDPGEYTRRLRAQDPGHRAVDFRGEKRSNATHRSATDPERRFASKGTTGSGAIPGYTVNALMENRHRILLGIGIEIFRSSASETEGFKRLLQRARRRLRFKPSTIGAEKGWASA